MLFMLLFFIICLCLITKYNNNLSVIYFLSFSIFLLPFSLFLLVTATEFTESLLSDDMLQKLQKCNGKSLFDTLYLFAHLVFVRFCAILNRWTKCGPVKRGLKLIENHSSFGGHFLNALVLANLFLEIAEKKCSFLQQGRI